MDDSQLLRVTSTPTDVETLCAEHARLQKMVEEQNTLIALMTEQIEWLYFRTAFSSEDIKYAAERGWPTLRKEVERE